MVKAGDIAPDAGLRALAEEGPVWVAFFKLSCPVCQLALPFWERLRDTRVVGVSQDDEEGTREFREYYKLTFPTVLDREEEGFPASNAFGITNVPTVFLIEPGGRIGRVIEGWNKQEMASLGVLREGEAVPAWKAG